MLPSPFDFSGRARRRFSSFADFLMRFNSTPHHSKDEPLRIGRYGTRLADCELPR